MVTLVETTELSEMHDAEAKWTQLWKISEGDTDTCLCHADKCQTKMARNIFRENLTKLCLRMGLLGGFSFIFLPHCSCLIASGYPGLIQRAVIKYLCSHAQSPPEGEGGSILTKYSFSRLSYVMAINNDGEIPLQTNLSRNWTDFFLSDYNWVQQPPFLWNICFMCS